MEKGLSGLWQRLKEKPFVSWVIFGGFLYLALALLAVIVPFAASGNIFVVVFAVGFAVPFLVGALLALTAKRWAFGVTAGISIFFLILLLLLAASTLSNPANPFFALSLTAPIVLAVIAGFSILSFKHAKEGLSKKRYLASPQSSGGLMALALVGFVVGSLLVTSIAAAMIGYLLSNAGRPADVRIVSNAAGSPEPYSPQAISIRRGGVVTWVNTDTMEHTVTSNVTGQGQFNSGLLNSGGWFTHTFPDTGTFEYHCDPHPWMWGVIEVTP